MAQLLDHVKLEVTIEMSIEGVDFADCGNYFSAFFVREDGNEATESVLDFEVIVAFHNLITVSHQPRKLVKPIRSKVEILE